MDLSDAFARSCNGVYAQLAVELGPTFCRTTPGRGAGGLLRQRHPHSLRGCSPPGAAARGWSGVGQYEDMVNPCAMLALMGSIASDDRAATPRLLYRRPAYWGCPPPFPAKEKRAAVFTTAETRQTLRDMMAHNVQETYGQSRFGGSGGLRQVRHGGGQRRCSSCVVRGLRGRQHPAVGFRGGGGARRRARRGRLRRRPAAGAGTELKISASGVTEADIFTGISPVAPWACGPCAAWRDGLPRRDSPAASMAMGTRPAISGKAAVSFSGSNIPT